MGPRYDADYDAMQCVSRNGSACANCANRMSFIGRRGDKGAWNKPCKGAKRPDPDGSGRLRSSYGGSKVAQQQVYSGLENLDTEGNVDHSVVHQSQAAHVSLHAQAADMARDFGPEGTSDIDWFSMAE